MSRTSGIVRTLLIVAGVCLLWLGLNYAGQLPPRGLTSAHMARVLRHMRAYILARREYPQTLESLPKTSNRYEFEDVDDVWDGWGRPLICSVESSGVVSLISYGRDGIPGGEGEDMDMIRYVDFSRDELVMQHLKSRSESLRKDTTMVPGGSV